MLYKSDESKAVLSTNTNELKQYKRLKKKLAMANNHETRIGLLEAQINKMAEKIAALETKLGSLNADS